MKYLRTNEIPEFLEKMFEKMQGLNPYGPDALSGSICDSAILNSSNLNRAMRIALSESVTLVGMASRKRDRQKQVQR